MSRWQALVPIKQGATGKSRLGGVLDDGERRALVRAMAAHVLSVLDQCRDVGCVTVLSPERPAGWPGAWQYDRGRGLNTELSAWRAALGGAPGLVLHADLPLLAEGDVTALLNLADAQGAALATDRAGLGTNALALGHGGAFAFRFGRMSRLLHTAQLPAMPVLQRIGLMADLDTPDDLQFAEAHGFRVGQACRREGSIRRPGLHNDSNRSGQECVT